MSVIYKCDICDAEVENLKLKKISIPAIEDNMWTNYKIFKRVEMCSDCVKRYRESVTNGFGTYYTNSKRFVKCADWSDVNE